MNEQKSVGATKDEIQDWETIWIQAVARAWKDTAFAGRLTKSPASAREALLEELSYSLPAGVELNIIQLDQDQAASGAFEWQAGGKASSLKEAATITLPLPPKPSALRNEATSLSELMVNVRAGGCMGACF